jgi:hypothetical protein
MGHRLRLHRTRTEFRWPCSVSVLPRPHSTQAQRTCYRSSTHEKKSQHASHFSTVRRFWRPVSAASSQRQCSKWMVFEALLVGDGCSYCALSLILFTPHTDFCRSEGAVTALVAIWGFFMLPNTPLTTSWLKPHEREMAHARMERDRVGDSTEPVSMMEGLRQACRDKRTWLFCLMQNFHLSACSFNSFFPT